MKKLALLLSLISTPLAFAETDKPPQALQSETINYCNSEDKNLQWEGLIVQYPYDEEDSQAPYLALPRIMDDRKFLLEKVNGLS